MRVVCTCVAIAFIAASLHGCSNAPTASPTLPPAPTPSPAQICASSQPSPAGVVNATTYSGKVLGSIKIGGVDDPIRACLCELDAPGWDGRGKNSTRGLPLSITPLHTSTIDGLTDVICTAFDYDAKSVPAPGSFTTVSRRLPVFAPKPSPIPCAGAGTQCIYITVSSRSVETWTLVKQEVTNTSWHTAPPASFNTSVWFSVDELTCPESGPRFEVAYTANGGASYISFQRSCYGRGILATGTDYKDYSSTSLTTINGDYHDPDIFVLQFYSEVPDELGSESVPVTTMKRIVQHRTRRGGHAAMILSTLHASQDSAVAIV